MTTRPQGISQMRKRLYTFLLPLAFCLLPLAFAQEVKATYTKYEYEISMRDGAKLFTSVYVPKDDTQKYPIMLQRTPYSVGPYGVDRNRGALGPSEHFKKEAFISAYHDFPDRYLPKDACTYI